MAEKYISIDQFVPYVFPAAEVQEVIDTSHR